MNTYDFLNLSSIEFEELSRDLLQKHYDCYLESFTEGRDGGIDLRRSLNNEGTLLIQCKRYKDFKSLKSGLVKEAEKVRSIKPEKYVLVTSAGLTPNNKKQILKMFHPFIQDSSDIFGKNDLNNLISSYEGIELKYYKLWMSSTKVQNKVLHGNIINRSEFFIENINKDIRMFVQNESFNEAVRILNENNFIIISGNPGVGKTTLAKMLVYQYLANDFEVIEVTEDIEEANEILQRGKKQVFYYDDFLGSNFLEKSIAKNEEKRLYSFMERVRNSQNHKLIMTTREYILNQARQKYEVLGRADVDLGKHILDLEKFTKLSKAEILYNHLFFSSLNTELITSVLDNKNYIKIINHPNYNPRVIELMTIRLDTKMVEPTSYVEMIIKALENPSQIWRHAFENQISEISKYLLYALLVSNSAISEEGLLKIVKGMVTLERESYNFVLQRGDFLNALKELENTFIRITKSYNGENSIQFQNPSIKDFLIHYIENDSDLIKLLIESMMYFNHLFTIFDLYGTNYKNGIDILEFIKKQTTKKIKLTTNFKKIMEDKIINSFNEMGYYSYDSEISISNLYKKKLIYLHSYYDYSNKQINQLVANVINIIEIEDCIFDEKETLVEIIIKINDLITMDIYQFIDLYVDNMGTLSDVKGLMGLSKLYNSEYEIYIGKNSNYLKSSILDAVDNDISEVSKTEDDINSLIDELEDVGKFFETAMKSKISSLQEKLEDLNKGSDENDSETLRGYNEQKINDDMVDRKINNMFSSLRT